MTQPQTNEQLAYSLTAVSNSLQQMQAGVASGDLMIDPDSGQALASALVTAREKSRSILSRMDSLATPAQLGTNGVSTAMTDKFSRRAQGAEDALAPMLRQHIDLLDAAQAAITTAVSNFTATDGGISDGLSGPR